MKLRNFLIVLFAVLMVFAFASCKNEPKVDPKPTPKPQPQIPDYYQIEVTEGVDKDYWNRDKIKIEWEEEVNAGDVVSLKYRSERDVYQWDIRDGSLKWVYETKKGSFTDPVQGEDGWWTLTYTFANDIDGKAVDSNERFGIYFRGNYVTTDLFEIKDITLNGEPLEITQDNIKSYAVLNDTEDHPLVEHDWSVKNWSVLFATGTVGEVDKTPLAEKVLDGGLVTGAPVNKEGYTLSIFTDAARTIPFDATQPIHEEKIFYYQYVGVPRTITFNTMGGSELEPITVPNGDMLGETEEPTLEGKAFKAWYKDEGLTEAWVMTDAVLGDMTLYAAYGDPATVTFQANNGEEPATKIVAIGNPVKAPETPTNGSKMFLGWYSDAECTVAYDFSAPVTADITVYAAWVNATDVTLNLNYEGAPAATTFKTALDVALAADDENLEVEARPGFIFGGWYTDAACTTAYNYETVVTAPFTLYAKWTYGTIYRLTSTKYTSVDGNSDDKFVLMWDAATAGVNAGDVFSITFRTTEPFTQYSIRKDNPSTLSKFFHEKSSGTYPQWFSSMETGDDGWTTVTYIFPETSTATQSASIPYEEGGIGFRVYFRNQKMVPNAIMEVRAVTINGKEVAIAAANVGSYASPTLETLEKLADWTKQTVTFNMGVADAIDPVEVDFGGKVEKPADPAKDGYVFAGWYADAEFTTEFDFGVAITKATTIYAKIGEKKTVTFNVNEGSAIDPVDVASGEKVAKPADPTKEGSVFDGWYTESTFENEYDFDAAVTADITLYAKWISSVKLTYNLNYTGAPDAQVADVEKSVALTAPKNPSRVGYYFGGWYTDAECTAEFAFASGIAADTTVYAKWDAPTKSYKYTLSDPLDDYSHTEAERIQFRWKSGSVEMLGDVKAGDTITLMMKASGGLSKVRFRAVNKNFDVYGTISDSVDGWIPVTLTLSADYASTGGFTMMVYESSNAKPGDVLEIKALAFNGTSIAITSSSSTGLYPSADAEGCYGPKAAMETIDL